MSFVNSVYGAVGGALLSFAKFELRGIYEGDEDAVTFCADAELYLHDFGGLAGHGWVGHTSCVDLIVRGSDARVTSVTIEGEDLGIVLERAGHSQLAADWRQREAEGGLPLLTQAIEALYRPGTSR